MPIKAMINITVRVLGWDAELKIVKLYSRIRRRDEQVREQTDRDGEHRECNQKRRTDKRPKFSAAP